MISTTIAGNILDFPARARSLFSYRNTQVNFTRRHILPLLEKAKRENDGSLDESDFKKIMTYYGLAIPGILGESIALLRGKPLSEKERFALTYLGAITGLFDDFFDKQYLADEKIKSLLENPGSLVPQSSNEKLFLDCYNKALTYVHDQELVRHYFRKVYDAQIESKKQAGPGLTKDELLHITIHKGAVSVLFYRAAMSHSFLPGEEDALYKMGGVMQFGNDIFDVYKDRNSGIHTLVTTAIHIDPVRQLFITALNQGYDSIAKLGYKKSNIRKYIRMLSACFISRCFVCLDQLESNEVKTGGSFIPSEYSRQELVCDMEKKINLWRSLKYHIKHRVKIPADGKLL
jgi:hypothetical protein